MNNFHKIITFLFCVLSYLVSSQEANILTDRPDQSESIQTLTAKTFQLENGFAISDGHFDNELMLKYGLFKRTEIRFDANFQTNRNQHLHITPLTLSLKQNILENKGIIPSIATFGYINYYPNTKIIESDILLAFENLLSDKYFSFSSFGPHSNPGVWAGDTTGSANSRIFPIGSLNAQSQ